MYINGKYKQTILMKHFDVTVCKIKAVNCRSKNPWHFSDPDTLCRAFKVKIGLIVL